MKLIYNRLQSAKSISTQIVTIPLDKFYKRQQRLQRYRVYKAGLQKYQVKELNTGIKYIIDLRKWNYNCTNFTEYKAPCCYVIIVCKYSQNYPFNYFLDFYTVRAFRYTYRRPLAPISINDLPSDLTIKPLLLVKLYRRPKTKRIRKGALTRVARNYSNHGEKGYNRRSCRGQPKSISYRGRAYNQLDSEQEQEVKARVIKRIIQLQRINLILSWLSIDLVQNEQRLEQLGQRRSVHVGRRVIVIFHHQ